MIIHANKNVILGFDEDNNILCNLNGQMGYFLDLETLLLIKEQLEPTIQFAMEHDISRLNEELMYQRLEEFKRRIGGHLKKEVGPAVGYVYIVFNGDHYKIGKSAGEKRANNYKTYFKNPCVIINQQVGDYHTLEKVLHDTFWLCRDHGEWYNLSDSELNEAIKIIQNHSI